MQIKGSTEDMMKNVSNILEKVLLITEMHTTKHGNGTHNKIPNLRDMIKTFSEYFTKQPETFLDIFIKKTVTFFSPFLRLYLS